MSLTIRQRSEKLLKFVKKAPKTGRTYTDMLKFMVDTMFNDDYCWRSDRGLIAHCMPVIRENCVKSGKRYIYG